MSIVGLIIVLIVFGGALYVVQLLPLDATVKRIIQVIAIIALVLWLAQALGLVSGAPLRLR